MNIYLATQPGTQFYKIGISKKDPILRIKEIQIGNAIELTLIASFVTKWDYKLEAALHARYKLNQVNSEWFELTDEEVSLFIDVCTKLEETFDVLKKYNNPFF